MSWNDDAGHRGSSPPRLEFQEGGSCFAGDPLARDCVERFAEDTVQHVPELMTSPARSHVARAARYTAGVSVALLLLVLTVRLALGPIHAVQDAAGCERAYADARTRMDSLSVTYLSFPDPAARQLRHRCGELRAGVVSAPGR
jgi:hypothetical protein